jgi:dolichyl-phosphate-mannose--protein O-mannosyl transferase
VLLLGVVALFWFHWPVLTGTAITQQEWAARVADWSRIPFWRPNWV